MLNADGFFDEESVRGEPPADWKKTPGNAVMKVETEGNGWDTGSKKPKTKAVGVERLDIDMDPFAASKTEYEEGQTLLAAVKGKYGSKEVQSRLKSEYTDANPSSKEPGGTKVSIYRPAKARPFEIHHKATGDEPSFVDLAYHHNISFEQLKILWNFAMAYAKKTQDRKPIVSYMQNCFDIPKANAKEYAYDFLFGSAEVPTATVRSMLLDRVTWMGWNLVEGPPSSHRHDDPGTRFDDFDTPYLPAKYKGRMLAIKALNGDIENLTRKLSADKILTQKSTVNVGDGSFGEGYSDLVVSLDTNIRGIRAFLADPFIPFDPNMWVWKERGKTYRFALRR
ncbi:MAG: hypothetical protein ACYC61_17930 [Isosphaeraceae bacterium]